MTQTFNSIPATQTLQSSRQMLLDRDEAAASSFAGTSFPSTNLLVGMRCHRTDLGKVYVLKDTTPTWVEVEDVTGATGLVPRATQLATNRAFSISGDASANPINFNGTGDVALSLTLAATGVTAGTYTKVTVDAKGRVTGGAALVNGDLPADISKTTLRATATTSVSLASTGHGFQIGADAGVNLAVDRAAIQARSNGAASALSLNPLGGNVTLGDGTTTAITLGGSIVSTSLAIATQVEAAAGASVTKLMTPQRTAQAIAALTGSASQTIFSASGTWSKPSWLRSTSMVLVQVWGAGGAGGLNTGGSSSGGGGGGGAYVEKLFKASDLAASVSVSVGAGGIAPTVSGSGGAGGNSSFGAYLTAYGGNGGSSSGSSGDAIGGDGGGLVSGAQVGTTLGGGAGGYTPSSTVSVPPGGSIFGGGGGGGGYTAEATNGGSSVYGGAGGGGSSAVYSTGFGGSGGVSLYGGNGGQARDNAVSDAGVAPGGGGGGGSSGAGKSGNGARGEVRVTIFY